MEDSEIVALYLRRDQAAIDETATKYGPLCRRVALNILATERDAEECVNDALLSAWNAIPPEEPERMGAYLGRLTRNLALNRLKARKARKRGGGEAEAAIEELRDLAGTLGDPEGHVESVELTAAIERFLRSLPEGKRRTFIRRYWYLYPVKEIARAEGCGVSRVKSELARLRQKLRTYLKEEGYDV